MLTTTMETMVCPRIRKKENMVADAGASKKVKNEKHAAIGAVVRAAHDAPKGSMDK